MKPIRLLYITNQICGSGGLERVLSIKASYLADNLGYEIHILTLNQGSANLFYVFSSKIYHHDILVKGNPIKYFNQYRKGLLEKIKEIKPDVISVCDDGFKGFFVPQILKKPCAMVYERHASKEILKPTKRNHVLKKIEFRIMNFLMHMGGKNYDAFIVLTDSNRMEWKLKNIQVIPNPLSFYPKNNEVSGLTNKKVIAVGNHGYQKGFDRLLKIWQSVIKKYPTWKLEIYGKIDLEKKNVKLAKKMGISDKVLIHKPVKDISAKYKEASIYVMSSRSEGFGMVLIEAMIHGLPCISFDCPSGPKDIISDDIDGYLVKNGDNSTFVNRVVSLIENEDKRMDMGLNARLKATKYLPENIMPIWDRLFNSLIPD